MDFTCFSLAATTMAPAEKLLPPAAAPSPSSAPPCRKLPFFRFVPASAPPPSFPPPSPAPPPAEPSRATGTVTVEDEEPRPPLAGPGAGRDSAAASASAKAAAEVEDRMDQLWEDFNEELGQLARARRRARPRGGSWRGDGQLATEGGRRRRTWSEPSPCPPSSDAESEPAAASAGCAPVLRPSARAAGGARHCRRRAGTWVLLMRIFRRLFVIEKTISSAATVARQRSSSSTSRAR